jgi:hypothetical protein
LYFSFAPLANSKLSYKRCHQKRKSKDTSRKKQINNFLLWLVVKSAFWAWLSFVKNKRSQLLRKNYSPLYKALIWHLLKWNLGLFWAFLAFFSLLSLTDHLFHEQDRDFVFCALENFAIDRLWY